MTLASLNFITFGWQNNTNILEHYKKFNKAYPIIAVIDTDYDLYDRDTVHSYYINRNEIDGNNIDDDNNKWVDDYCIINTADLKTYQIKTPVEEWRENTIERLGEKLYLTEYPPTDEYDRNPYYHGHIVSSIIASSTK